MASDTAIGRQELWCQLFISMQSLLVSGLGRRWRGNLAEGGATQHKQNGKNNA
jgi:hypothetical protein